MKVIQLPLNGVHVGEVVRVFIVQFLQTPFKIVDPLKDLFFLFRWGCQDATLNP